MIENHLQLTIQSTTAHYKIYIIYVVDDFQSSTTYNTIYMIYVVDDC